VPLVWREEDFEEDLQRPRHELDASEDRESAKKMKKKMQVFQMARMEQPIF
jgi:hypothetical protein